MPANFQSAATTAAGRWNLVFGHAESGYPASSWAPGIPRLVIVSDSSGADVIMEVVGSTSASGDFCGGYNHSTKRITLQHGTAPAAPCSTNSADATRTLVHEFAHVLGFNTIQENGPAETNCAIRLTDIGGTINGTPCQHEVEYILIAYGFGFGGNAARNPGEDWWDDPILTDLVVSPAIDTLNVDASGTLTVQSLKYGGTTQSVDDLRFSWSSDNEEVAAVGTGSPSVSREISAAAPGTTVVRAVPATGIPSGHIVSAKLGILGKAVPITVLPNTGPFQITDITGPAAPITTPDSVTFHTVVQNPPPGTVYYRWQLEASNGAFPEVDVETTSSSGGLSVPGGSYQITVTVTPSVGDSTAYHRTETWPVCTDGGGEFLIVPVPGGGGTPKAKQGC